MKEKDVIQLIKNRKYILAEIEDKKLQIEEVQTIGSMSIQSTSFDERVQTSNISNTTEQYAYQNMADEAMLEIDKISLETQIKRLDEAMKLLDKTELKVLELKYANNNTWRATRVELKHETGDVVRVARKAIEKLCKIMK
ncbi:MAG TPA: hypothetical protein VIK72_19305 [Clostridiaceae bacterium]